MNDQPRHETAPAVDMSRYAQLDGHFAVAVCVAADGTESYWLLSSNGGDDPGCNCAACAPHEQAAPFLINPTKVEPT